MATITVATLEERVNNYIKFFWTVVAFGFLWLTGLTMFMLHINDTLSGISHAQIAAENRFTQQAIVNYSALPPDEFKAVLPDLSSAIATAKRRDIKVPSKVIGDLQTKLIASAGAPSFWPTAAEFISYRSFNGAAAIASGNLPNCTDSSPALGTVKEVYSPTQMSINPGTYENCRFTLDSAEDNARMNMFLTTVTPLIAFRHCLIVYRGGTINLILALKEYNAAYQVFTNPPASGTVNVSVDHTLEFHDCLFDITLQAAPPQPGQELTRFLLAESGGDIVLPLSASTHS
jgi:hypothetical protein